MTAETAVALPALVAVVVVLLAGLSAGVDQLRCVDAARVAARALARGEDPARAAAAAQAAAPPGAGVSVRAQGDLVQVVVTARARTWPGAAARAGPTLRGEAVAWREPGWGGGR